MPAYALLLRASANRVYGAALPGLAAAELAYLDRHVLGGRLGPARPEALAGVDYLLVEAEAALGPADLAVVANLSALHAAFAREGELLRPLPLSPLRARDDDITTIQRYVGKTNEGLTHLLVNLALAAADGAFGRALAGERVRLLDPLCGRGTTLNRGVVYGLDAIGLEHDKRDVEAYEAFLLGWLRDKRVKHDVERARLRRGRPAPARRVTVTYGAPPRDPGARQVEVIHDDTANLGDHVRARSVDALVADLPYGVQHGAASGGRSARSPEQLLATALPAWREALRPGAGVALSWNRRTLERDELLGLLGSHGFEPCAAAGDDAFVHRVDRSITRDVVVARRGG